MRPTPFARCRATLLAAWLLLFVIPAAADAHAELETATPKDGATVAGTPPEISGRYSEAMDPGGSSLKLVDASGATIASGAVDPQDTERMGIDPVPALTPGTYTVKSTTKSAADGDIDHATWSFKVVAASPSPTASPTPICTDGCNGQPTGELPSPTATATPATANPSDAAATATPSPSDGSGAPTSSTGDIVLPIVAGLAVVVVGLLRLTRRGRTSSGR